MKFLSDAEPVLVRHQEYNPRQQMGVKARYIQSIKARGLVESVRGECWAIMPDVPGGPYRLLSCASLVEALYEAAQQDPENPNIVATLKAGIELRPLDVKTPSAISKYLVKLHNRFHGGAATNYIELMTTVPEVTWKHPSVLQSFSLLVLQSYTLTRLDIKYMQYVISADV